MLDVLRLGVRTDIHPVRNLAHVRQFKSYIYRYILFFMLVVIMHSGGQTDRPIYTIRSVCVCVCMQSVLTLIGHCSTSAQSNTIATINLQ